MKGFHRSHRAPKPCTLHVLSDHQLKDIGLFGIAFAVVAGTDSQASVHPPCDSPKLLATRGGETHRALSLAMMPILALILLIAFAATVVALQLTMRMRVSDFNELALYLI